jgi:hypothetical protein
LAGERVVELEVVELDAADFDDLELDDAVEVDPALDRDPAVDLDPVGDLDRDPVAADLVAEAGDAGVIVEAELGAGDETTAPPAAVSSPMALDWEDEEDATLVYEREESPYEAEAKVVIDEALAVCDEAPTTRHGGAAPTSVPVTTFAGLAPSPMGAHHFAPSGPRWIETSARRRVDGPSAAPAPLPVVTTPKVPPTRPYGTLNPLPPPVSPPVPAAPLPAAALPPAGMGNRDATGASRDEVDIPRSLPFGRPNEPTLVQGIPAAAVPNGVAAAQGAGRDVPSSVPPPFVGEPRILAARSGRNGAGSSASGAKVWAALGMAAVVAAAAVVAGFLWAPSKGQLEVVVVDAEGNAVPSAEVFLDGKKQCESAPCIAGDLPTGSTLVRAVAPGFIGDGVVTAEVASGDDNRITIELRPEIEVADAPEAAAPADAPVADAPADAPVADAPTDAPVPAAPVPAPPAAGPASPSPASLSKAPAPPPEVSAPAPDEPKVAAKSGRLNVNSIPVSRVLVDGAALGETPRVDIELSPGIHTVTFVHPDLGRKSVSVNIKAGQTATAAVKLRD